MSGVASAVPDELDRFADTARELAEHQRRVMRQLELALETARRHGHAIAQTRADDTKRAMRSILGAHLALASQAVQAAQAFRAADQVLASLGWDGEISGGDSDSWTVDVPLPGSDWRFRWRAPGFPFEQWGWSSGRSRLTVETGAGPRINAQAGASVVEGLLNIGAGLEASVGAWVRAAMATGLGPFAAAAAGELFVGVSSTGRAAVSIGRNGVAVDAGAGVFAGGRASGEVGVDVGPAGAAATGAVTVGIGAKAEVDAAFGWDRVAMRWNLGATFGVGGELGGELHLQPRELFNGIVDLGDDVKDAASSVIRAGADGMRSGVDVAGDLASSVATTGVDLVGDGAELAADVGGALKDGAGKAAGTMVSGGKRLLGL